MNKQTPLLSLFCWNKIFWQIHKYLWTVNYKHPLYPYLIINRIFVLITIRNPNLQALITLLLVRLYDISDPYVLDCSGCLLSGFSGLHQSSGPMWGFSGLHQWSGPMSGFSGLYYLITVSLFRPSEPSQHSSKTLIPFLTLTTLICGLRDNSQ